MFVGLWRGPQRGDGIRGSTEESGRWPRRLARTSMTQQMQSSHPWGSRGEREAAMAACARVLGEVDEERTPVTESPVRICGVVE